MPEPKKKRTKSTGGQYVTLPLLFEKLESITAQNRAEHEGIRLEINKGLSNVKDSQNGLSERLVKIETIPGPEKFQKEFCPNTREINELIDWQKENKKTVENIYAKIGECEKKIDNFMVFSKDEREKFEDLVREERVNFDAERTRMELRGMKRMKMAIIGMVLSVVGSAFVTIITNVIGLW